MSTGLQSAPSLRRSRGPRPPDQGSTLVEFSLVASLLLLFMLGIMDFSKFLYTYHFVSEVAREGTRYAAVRGATFAGTSCTLTPLTYGCAATAANVSGYVQSLTPPGMKSSSLTVTPTWPGTAPTGAVTSCNTTVTTNGVKDSPGCLVQVFVSYPYKFIFPFLPSGASTYTVSSTSEMVISQ